MAGVGQFAGTGKVFPLQLGGIKVRFQEMVTIEDDGASLPTSRLHRCRNIWLRAHQCVDVLFLDRVGPLGPGTDIDHVRARFGVASTLNALRASERCRFGIDGIQGHQGVNAAMSKMLRVGA
jgi:hypothetical protein